MLNSNPASPTTPPSTGGSTNRNDKLKSTPTPTALPITEEKDCMWFWLLIIIATIIVLMLATRCKHK